MTGLDEEKIKPTSTGVDGAQSQIGQGPIAHSAAGGIAPQRLGKQAKAIMDEFVKALDKVGEISGEVGIERAEFTREAKATKPEEGFRKRMLANAPRKDSEHIMAEKKSW